MAKTLTVGFPEMLKDCDVDHLDDSHDDDGGQRRLGDVVAVLHQHGQGHEDQCAWNQIKGAVSCLCCIKPF